MRIGAILSCLILPFVTSGCGPSAVSGVDANSSFPDASYGTAGRVPASAPDEFCKGKNVSSIDPKQCTGGGSDVSDDAIDTAGDATSAGDEGSEYGPTRSGSEADDDDCKYHVKWRSSGAGLNTDVYFEVDLTTLGDKKPATHVVDAQHPIVVEAFVDAGDPAKNHGAPNSGQTSAETATAGKYLVGPLHFDQATRWTVRFHLYSDCDDGAQSPHGHVAFLFDVK